MPPCVADVPTVDCALCRQSNKRALLFLLHSFITSLYLTETDKYCELSRITMMRHTKWAYCDGDVKRETQLSQSLRISGGTTEVPLWSTRVWLFVCSFHTISQQESPLSLTDPRDAVAQRMLNIPYRIKPFLLLVLGLAAEYRSRRWVWSTVVRRPSEVYVTHRRTKLSCWQRLKRWVVPEIRLVPTKF